VIDRDRKFLDPKIVSATSAVMHAAPPVSLAADGCVFIPAWRTRESILAGKAADVKRKESRPEAQAEPDGCFRFDPAISVGFQVRMTHRMMQRALQAKIAPAGATLGMWYFLRALWNEDGLTQRELSDRTGTMEPTTMSAIQSMEEKGLVERVRNKSDRRKINVFLTEKGRALEQDLLPVAADVVATAIKGFSVRDVATLLDLLSTIQANLAAENVADTDIPI
jgi:DNA-binding MarR family transcriptional regulator